MFDIGDLFDHKDRDETGTVDEMWFVGWDVSAQN
jgi:hypothetical protein